MEIYMTEEDIECEIKKEKREIFYLDVLASPKTSAMTS